MYLFININFVANEAQLRCQISEGVSDHVHISVYACLQVRSETIATYALCGFANFGSLGIVIGGLSKWKEYSSTTVVTLWVHPAL